MLLTVSLYTDTSGPTFAPLHNENSNNEQTNVSVQRLLSTADRLPNWPINFGFVITDFHISPTEDRSTYFIVGLNTVYSLSCASGSRYKNIFRVPTAQDINTFFVCQRLKR